MRKIEDWDTWKRRRFPWVKDWKLTQTKIAETHPRDLDWDTWFWFHPSAYSFIHFGINVQVILLFTPLSFWLYFAKDRPFGAVICLIFVILMFINLIKKIINKNKIKGVTFFDIHLREYEIK